MRSLSQVVKGRSEPIIQAVRGQELIAEDTEEPRFAEKRSFSVLGEPRLLGVLGDKPFFGFRRIHRKTGRQQ